MSKNQTDDDILKSILEEASNDNNNLLNQNENYDIEKIMKESEELYGSKNIANEEDIENILNEINNNSDKLNGYNKDLSDKSNNLYKKKKNLNANSSLKFFPEIKSNTEFIEFFEKEYIKSTLISLKNPEKFCLLKTYKNSIKNIKLSVLNISNKNTIANILYKHSKTKFVSCIAAHNDLIYTGNAIGIIQMFTCEKEHFLKSYTCKEVEGNCSVTCIDINHDGEFLLSGYTNGAIILWDTCTAKIKKIVQNVYRSCVLDIKFTNVSSKKKWEFVASDLESNIKFFKISDGLFSISIDYEDITKEKHSKISFHQLKVFNILDYRLRELGLHAKHNNFISSTFIGASSINSICVYSLEHKLRIFSIEKPSYLKDISAPECSFGYGFIPEGSLSNDTLNTQNIEFNENTSTKTFTTEFSKRNYNDNTNNNNYQNSYYSKKDSRFNLLFSVFWGKVCTIYAITFKSKLVPYFTPVAHFINNIPIIRMEFLSDSILYLFDKNRSVKVVNTSLMIPGDVKIDYSLENPFPINQTMGNTTAELDQGTKVDEDLHMQTYVVDSFSKEKRPTYNNVIVSIPKCIYVLGTKKFHQLKLLNWEQYLSEISKINSDWMDALCLGIDIYNGKNSALADIPTDTKIRKIKVGAELEHLIHHYAILHTSNEKNFQNSLFVEKLINCISICIEFCLELEKVDYLLNTLQPLFDLKGYGDIFIEKLEPFILNSKNANSSFQNNNIANSNNLNSTYDLNRYLQQMTISKIIDIYLKNDKIDALSQILIHLDLKSMDVDYVREICSKKKLITPLIYICTNSMVEDYLSPLYIMWNMFKKAENVSINKIFDDPNIKHSLITNNSNFFISYIELLEANKVTNYELENSKQYIGHKILWYLSYCFSGKKITNEPISANKMENLLFILLKWILLEGHHLEELLIFDSKTTLMLIEKLYKNQFLKCIIENFENNPDLVKDIDSLDLQSSSSNNQFSNVNNDENNKNYISLEGKPTKIIFSLTGILDYLTHVSKKINSNNLRDIYEFIIRIAIFFNKINKVQIIDAAKYLLKHDIDANIKISPSFFKNHLEEFSNNLIEMIQTNKELNKEDYSELLKSAQLSPYLMVKVYLNKELKNYKSCLQILLNSNDFLINKEKLVFDWISDTLQDLNNIGDPDFEILKKEVLDNLNLLADMSIEFVSKLVEKWFENNQLYVIHKLDNAKNLQLKYVESVLEKFKEEADYNLESSKSAEQYQSLLKLQIRLLCKIRPKDVLPNLIKRGQVYPINECLESCLQYKVYDGAIYLKQTLGEIKEALEISINLLNVSFEDLLAYLKGENLPERIFDSKVNDFSSKLKLSVDILEKNSDKTDYSEEPELWFILLERLYSFSSRIKESFNLVSTSIGIHSTSYIHNNNDRFISFLLDKLSDDIKSLLEKMCSYVSIHLIITVSLLYT